MKVKVLKRYFDKQLSEYKEKDAEFEVDEKRAEVLVKAKVAKTIEEPEKKVTKKV